MLSSTLNCSPLKPINKDDIKGVNKEENGNSDCQPSVKRKEVTFSEFNEVYEKVTKMHTNTIKEENFDIKQEEIDISDCESVKQEQVETTDSNEPTPNHKYFLLLFYRHQTKFYCKKCNFTASTAQALEEHNAKYKDTNIGSRLRSGKTCQEPDKEILYKCDVCQYQAKCKSGLKQHQKIHLRLQKRNSKLDKPKRYVCETCGFKTKYEMSLRRHLKQHL